jgi:hypothetical protein
MLSNICIISKIMFDRRCHHPIPDLASDDRPACHWPLARSGRLTASSEATREERKKDDSRPLFLLGLLACYLIFSRRRRRRRRRRRLNPGAKLASSASLPNRRLSQRFDEKGLIHSYLCHLPFSAFVARSIATNKN